MIVHSLTETTHVRRPFKQSSSSCSLSDDMKRSSLSGDMKRSSSSCSLSDDMKRSLLSGDMKRSSSSCSLSDMKRSASSCSLNDDMKRSSSTCSLSDMRRSASSCSLNDDMRRRSLSDDMKRSASSCSLNDDMKRIASSSFKPHKLSKKLKRKLSRIVRITKEVYNEKGLVSMHDIVDSTDMRVQDLQFAHDIVYSTDLLYPWFSVLIYICSIELNDKRHLNDRALFMTSMMCVFTTIKIHS
jgi:hypothetical protein